MIRYVSCIILSAIILCVLPYLAIAQDAGVSAVEESAAVLDTSPLPDLDAVAPTPQTNDSGEPLTVTGDEGEAISDTNSDSSVSSPDESMPLPEDTIALPPDIAALFEEPVDISKMPSLFFTKWEHGLLIDARRGVATRPVVPGDVGSELLLAPGDGAVAMSPREISLGGIAYLSSDNWTIWLNAIRITPTALPPEIMDIKVYKDRIELDWLDRSANKIYPIRLRPHEKFNLDTRMFLPADGQ